MVKKNKINLYVLIRTNSRAQDDTFVQIKKRGPFQADPASCQRTQFIEFQRPLSPQPSALCTTMYDSSAKMY